MDIKWTIGTKLWKCICSVKRSSYRLMKNVPKYYLGFIVLILVYISVHKLRFGDIVPPVYQKKNYPELGCQFPDLKPFSDVAMIFNKNLPKIVCRGKDWVECNVNNYYTNVHRIDSVNKIERSDPSTHIFQMSECKVNQHILDTTKDVICHYKDIKYISDRVYVVADPVTLYGDAVYKLNASDGVKVSCTGYDKGWLSILSKRWLGFKAGIRPLKRQSDGTNNTINILIVVFDSICRNCFIRKMRKSYKYLKDEMKAVILKGYNIVGDGTPDALFPILSGRSELQHPLARTQYNKQVLLDPDLFIFHTAKLHGYETAYLEDMPWIGTFQYRYNGFSRRPADHYLRSFFMEESKNGSKWWKGLKSRYCIGSTPQYRFLLNLSRQFMNIKTKRFCFTFIADISHDDINLVSTADDDLLNFLKYVKHNMIEDTMVMVMGDHGPRFTPMRAFYEGRMEERLPFMSIILPERLKKQRRDALYFLKSNAAILTTPYDIHTTLLDAMGLEKYASDFVVPNAEIKRGMSLLKPIPVSRSCASAGVLPHWCACVSARWRNVPFDAPVYKTVANELIDFINEFISEKRELCVKRELISIAWVVSQETKDLSQKDVIYYQTLIISSPGRAAFEASMQYDAKRKRFIISDKEISRISAYGNEPKCVSETHPHLTKYCYCKNT